LIDALQDELTRIGKTLKIRVLSALAHLFLVASVSSWGVAKLVKAPDFDSGMRRFESFLPSQIFSGGLFSRSWARLFIARFA
jgi:hypothetical protein